MYKIKERNKEQKMICRNDACVVLDAQVKMENKGVVWRRKLGDAKDM